MAFDWRAALARRPWWMNALMFFCAYMTFVYMPFDLIWKPVHEDVEVWFGLTLHGWAAKVTEPLHWAIYAAGLVGFWKMARWMHPWAALYVAQIAIGMFVWAAIVQSSPGWWAGLLPASAFGALAWLIWREGHRFGSQVSAETE